jgi:hypothetical protein
MVGRAEYEAGRGGVLRGPRPPMVAPARVESDVVATSFFGCSEDHSSFNHPAKWYETTNLLIFLELIGGDNMCVG